MEIPAQLWRDIEAGKASLFLGAGASQAAGLPGSAELAQLLADRASLPDHLKDETRLDLLADHLYTLAGYGRNWVRDRVIEIIREGQGKGIADRCGSHRTLALLEWQVAFTTNYDNVFEIAYTLEESRAQDLVPYYDGSSAILRRRTPGRLRYLKLNGSADEAERNPEHVLVLTFAEQQAARSRNREFYETLRDAAINGPLIFVGFGFTHPGAHSPASSPEFELLRGLLAELGPAAKDHYCVFPFAVDDPSWDLLLTQLRASRIEPLNGTLESFAAVIKEKSRTRDSLPIPLDGVVDVRVGESVLQFTQRELALDSRYYELIHSTTWSDDDETPSLRNSVNGRSNWGTFFSGQAFPRKLSTELDAWASAEEGGTELLVVAAPVGWGKTFALRDLSARAALAGTPTLWLNPLATTELEQDGKTITLGTWDHRTIGATVKRINGVMDDSGLASPLIVIDDAPERSEEVLGLLKYLRRLDLAARIVFSVRDSDRSDLENARPEFKMATWYAPAELEDEPTLLRQLDDLIDYCVAGGILETMTVTEREYLRSRIVTDQAHTLILLALVVIYDREHRPFSRIVESMWESLSEMMEQDVLLRVCALHRLGNRVGPRLAALVRTYPPHERSDAFGAVYTIVKQGLMVERIEQSEPVLATLHSLFASEFLRVSGSSPEYIGELLLSLVANMTSHPYDRELLKRLAKRIADYDVLLPSSDYARELLEEAAISTNYDAVICQQLAKFLLASNQYDDALAWIDRALEQNDNYSPVVHTKGNILRRRGQARLRSGEEDEAESDFDEAREFFVRSRMMRGTDEYGYVTHLDMILALLNHSSGSHQEANLLAEGVDLYREGVAALPADKYNYLLSDRFRDRFHPKGEARMDLIKRIIGAEDEEVSPAARIYVAKELSSLGRVAEGIEFLRIGMETGKRDPLIPVTAAQLSMHTGALEEAQTWLQEARLLLKPGQHSEAAWRIPYLDQAVLFCLDDYRGAAEAGRDLAAAGMRPNDRLPRGYIWKSDALSVSESKRKFIDHARIFRGRVLADRGPHGDGKVRLMNAYGDYYDLRFRAQFFQRRTPTAGTTLDFVVALLPSGLRADDPEGIPFKNLPDAVFS